MSGRSAACSHLLLRATAFRSTSCRQSWESATQGRRMSGACHRRWAITIAVESIIRCSGGLMATAVESTAATAARQLVLRCGAADAAIPRGVDSPANETILPWRRTRGAECTRAGRRACGRSGRASSLCSRDIMDAHVAFHSWVRFQFRTSGFRCRFR